MLSSLAFTDLHDPAQRERLLNEHPIIRKPYTVLTPMIEQTYALMRERVWLRRTGSYMHARPRMGKSMCARTIKELIKHEFPTIVVTYLNADESRTALNVAKDLAVAIGLFIPGRSSYQEIMEKIILFIHSESASLTGNQFVLIIDEMQLLHEGDYKVLMVLHNRLEQRGILMTTLGFAQPEINEQRTALFATNAHNIIARFLSEPIPFNGCTSTESLRFILRGYDESKCFPVGSEWTYTRFFLPAAYDSGFRLATYSEVIWKELSAASEKLGSGSVPMEHLTRVVESFLVAGRLRDSKDYMLKKEEILRAIASSNLLEYVSSMRDGG